MLLFCVVILMFMILCYVWFLSFISIFHYDIYPFDIYIYTFVFFLSFLCVVYVFVLCVCAISCFYFVHLRVCYILWLVVVV